MVSLARGSQRSTGGGFSFATDGSVNADEDEIRILQPVLGEDSEAIQFKPLRTIPVAILELFLTVVFGTVAIAVGFLPWPEGRQHCEPFYILLYMQAIFWLITLVVHLYLRSRHHQLRLSGYLDFYLDMLVLYRMPIQVATLSTVLLLVVSTLIQELYVQLESQCEPSSRLATPIIYLGSIVLCQALVLSLCLIAYIARVRRFNKRQPPPDVEREEWLASLMEETYRRAEVGFREKRDQTEELLERQADLIRHLREHNMYLGLKVTQLSSRLSGDTE